MFPAAAASVTSTDHRRAYGAGVIAGALTLAVGWVLAVQLGLTGTADASSGLAYEAGDCLEISADEPPALRVVDCSQPHQGEVAGTATHPDSGRPYPGDDVSRIWFERGCEGVITDYLGADHLETTLSASVIAPTRDDWDDGVHHATCYLSVEEGAEPLTGSIRGRADDFARGDVVRLDRLMPGDCFDPTGSNDPFGLRTSDRVELTDCSGTFLGLFFGRGELPYPEELTIPPEDELTDSSTTVCSAEFETFFAVDSAVGYPFRFWRPSRSSWDDGDREALCAVLSDEPIDGPFVPADYPALHKLGTGQCFRLLPEQTAKSLTLDDHVRPTRCSEPHVGQMIGGGRLEADRSFPGDAQSKALTEQECSSLFEAFIGIAPVDSEFGRFPYWYPNEAAWAGNDTRYACAILEQGLDESLQGSRR